MKVQSDIEKENEPKIDNKSQDLEKEELYNEEDYENEMDEILKGINVKLIITLIVCIMSLFLLYRVIATFTRRESKFYDNYYIPQPLTETNNFNKMILQNGMEVLFIEPIEEIEKVYIALSIGVASEADPPYYQGFTHLLEHMLFTGSKLYPENNYIEKIVNKYRGSNNGETGDFATTYFYELHEEGLAEFLPVLADAIKNPLLDIETIKKEINNINSEISMRMTYEKKYDYYKFIKAIGNPQSRLFSDGFANIDPEGVDFEKLQSDLMEFHENYYTGKLMKMVVISDKNKSEILSAVETYFEDIPDGEMPRPFFNTTDTYQPPFLPEQYGKIYYMEGSIEPSTFRIVSVIDSQRQQTKFAPDDFIALLFTYNAKDSVKYNLEKEGLVIDIHCFKIFEDFKDEIFVFEFDLTEKGKKNISRILFHFYSFIEFVKNLDNRKEIYNYISKISKFGFLYNVGNEKLGITEEIDDYFDQANDFANQIQDYPLKELYSAGKIFDQYDDEVLLKTLDQISPEKCIYLFTSKSFRKKEMPKKTDTELNTDAVIEKDEPHMEDMLTNVEVNEEISINNRLKPKEIDHGSANRILTEKNPDPDAEKDPEADTEKNPDADTEKDPEVDTEKNPNPDVEDVQEVIDEDEMIQYNDPKAQETYLSQHFDDAIDNIELTEQFNFDNGKMYSVQDIDKVVLQTLKRDASESNLVYTIVHPTDTSFTNHYSIITTCIPPYILREKSIEMEEANVKYTFFKGDIKKHQLERLFSNKNNVINVDTAKLYEIIFNDDERDAQTLYNLDLYKYCLSGDFRVDSTETKMIRLKKNTNSFLYYKLYRKSMQPKFISIFTITSEFLWEKMVLSTDRKNEVSLFIDMFCSYLNRYIELEFHEDYINGCQFRCKRVSYKLVFIFSGISSIVKDFSLKVFDHIQTLQKPEDYDELIVKNVQENYKNYYSNFEAKTSKDVAVYYLNVIMDSLLMDYSTKKSLDKILYMIKYVNGELFAEIIREVFNKYKISLSNVGNVSQKESIEMIDHIENSGISQETDFHPGIENRDIRKNFIKKLVLRFNLNEHAMIRLTNNDKEETNNTYLTYFKFDLLSKRDYLMLKVTNHLLKDFVFNRFRNELNLGYVSSSFIIEYHNITGIGILIEGETFRPNEIEDAVEIAIKDFVKLVRRLNISDYKKLCKTLVDEMEDYHNSLSVAANKLYKRKVK